LTGPGWVDWRAMDTARALIAVTACAGLLAGCSQQDEQDAAPQPDIGRVLELKSEFGPEFKVNEVAKSGIDPAMLRQQQTPKGVTFEPPDCAKLAENQLFPPGMQGNMAAVTAEGEGNRFIVIAVETSDPVTLPDPGEQCRRVTFTGGPVKGTIEIVDTPPVPDARTLGSHRTVEVTLGGKPTSGELYSYVAAFGDYLVVVTANPLIKPNEPVPPINDERARNLLVAAVKAVRGEQSEQ